MNRIKRLKLAWQIGSWAFVLGASYWMYSDIKQHLYNKGWLTHPSAAQQETPNTGLEERVLPYTLELNKEDPNVIR